MKIKKILLYFICFIITININTYSVLANQHLNKKENKLNVNARAYIALDANSKVVLAGRNSEVIMPMASTTKILTALVTLKYGDLDKMVEISSKASSIRGSVAGYKKGEEISLKELLFGLMLRSGNDAAIAIAEGVAGSEEEFVRLMNEYAASLGLIDSHFCSPHGLDSEEHYSTVYDLAILTAESKKHPLFHEIVSTKDITKDKYSFSRDYHNINKILWQLPNATGVKTGYTGGAGKCLVSSVDISGREVIIVVLDCPGRWKETIKVNNYVKKNYEYKKLHSKGEVVTKAPKDKKNIDLVCKEDIIIPTEKGTDYSVKINVPNEINHNIYEGDKVGSINVFKEDKLIFTESLVAKNSYKAPIIKKFPFKNIFKK
ncbi:D-alanyl-D-alanine carboxypeptidase [Clostridium tetani]|uniref:serine-type D-Ala-D-Ala carboxypeptidase n=1 Tax=Clostridium tetani TaxID=1513 RepID=A0A4Q0VCJ9_CLOTA|nr:D-alanyl-D-alanine carboxypeptidase family protein [Clostridium tetani]RXI49404.1 D-alanyl-D-alanine carboxypeptidase [Clostridium tetani]